MLGACCSGAPVKLFCWIVADDNGISSHTEASVSNHIVAVNRIYSQVAMTFERESMITTNSTRLTHVDYSNSVQKAELYDIGGRTGGLNVIFVETINPKFQQVMMLRIAVSALFYAGFRVGMTEHPAPLTGHSADSSKRLLPQAA